MIAEIEKRGPFAFYFLPRRSRTRGKVKLISFFDFTSLFFILMFLNTGICLAQDQKSSSIGAADDCTGISIDFKDAANLTRQERIDMMDKALLNSLNKSERCRNAHSRSSAAAGGGGGAAGAGSEGEGNAQQGSSTASSSMSGTNAAIEKDSSSGDQTRVDDAPVNKETHGRTKGVHVLGNGKIPGDIPPADNDSVLEEQIRQAAVNETDPVIKKKLWDEYRQYKGLPAVKKP